MPDAAKPLLLYVEDEVFTQHLVEESLRDAGYDVCTASDGTEAIAKLAALGERLCGLVTDVDLGDCPDGWQVAREARVHFPELPVVYVSGASSHQWDALGVPDSVVVPKPFSPHQIVTAISVVFARVGP